MMEHRFSSKRRVITIVAFLAAFVILLNATTYALYRRARTHLDNELGERLRTVAMGVARTVEFAVADSVTTEAIDSDLYTALYLTQEENLLSNIVLFTPDGGTIADLAGYSLPGEISPFIDLDFGAVTLARSGFPSYTKLYRTGDVYMKSAYAPITNAGGEVSAIVGVEAGAAFFAELRELSNVIVSISLGSLLVVVVLGVLFYRLSRSLDRAQETIIQREHLATLGRMVANIAHEIRNPLSIIRTSADRLKRKYEIDDETLDYISEEVDELNRILTGYLQLSQSSATFAPQSGRKIVARSLLAVRPEAESRQVTIDDVLPEEDVIINGDERRLRQALLNVLLNAVQATGPGGSVNVSLGTSADQAIILVSDSGCGIDAKDLAEITKPFFTRRTDGSGLGLHVVQTVVDEHSGTLNIDSDPGRGTRVTMSFPRPREST